MTDKELLEAAARAAGITDLECGPFGFYRVIGEHEDGKKCLVEWSPLIDDGDALRLAVKLHIGFMSKHDGETTVLYDPHNRLTQPHAADPCAATRRAIVRAAAAIGSRHNVGAVRQAATAAKPPPDGDCP